MTAMDVDERDEFPDFTADFRASQSNAMDHRMGNSFTEEESNLIFCPMCQTPIKPNPANLCVSCLNSQVDISEGISKQLVMFQCRQCERFYRNPQFVACQLESPELLAICLRKIRGLGKQIKLVNACFIWTEPHSKRIKVELTIQKEVFNGAIVQKKFPVEFVIENQQCEECEASFTHHTWRACVQVRQKVDHKKTFLYLEQLLLKHGATANCLGITEQRDGIDFFFSNKSQAQNFLGFLHTVVPIDAKLSKRLVSHDHKSNIAKFKYTVFAEIAPVCRLDLVCIPPKLRNKLGGKSPLMLCYKVTNCLHFIDPSTLHTIELDPSQYFRAHFQSMCNSRHLSRFFIMTSRHLRVRQRKFQLAELELVREDDIGDEQAPIFETVTHLGGILKEGDIVLGYDLQTLTAAQELFSDKSFLRATRKLKIPEVIVVKKYYERTERHRRRRWKLKSMLKDRAYHTDKNLLRKEEHDNEEFMRELEEEFELRCKINIYKQNKSLQSPALCSVTNGDDEVPRIPMEELLDDMEELKLDNGQNRGPRSMQSAGNDEDDDTQMTNID